MIDLTNFSAVHKFVSPQIMVQVIRRDLSRQLKKEITDFEIHLYRIDGNNNLWFVVDEKKIIMETSYLKMLDSIFSSKLDKVDAAICRINAENKINIEIYYRDNNNEKVFQKAEI